MIDQTSLAHLSQTIFALALVKPMKDCLLCLGVTMMFHGPRAFITHKFLLDDTTVFGGPDLGVHAAMTRLLQAYGRMGVRDILVVDVGRGFNFALPDDFGLLKALYIRLELSKIQRVSSRMISAGEVDSDDEDLVEGWLKKEKKGRKRSHAPKVGWLADNANLCHDAVLRISDCYKQVTSSLRKITPGASDETQPYSSFALEACLNEMVEVASTTGD
ncbi:hypothetical protein PENSPDRAFT_215496 [Peniophora sp. CONT]|nr:hypothetical protein PENSPDRAFT_215496 [Peniophora sp. CONT]